MWTPVWPELMKHDAQLLVVALGAIGVLILSGNPRESLVIRKFRGLSLVPTGHTNTLPPLFSSTSNWRIVQTTLNWLSKASLRDEEERSPLEVDLFSEQSTREYQQLETTLSLPVKSISAADISNMPTLRLTPVSRYSETPYPLPCGHESRKPDARYCSICGASAL